MKKILLLACTIGIALFTQAQSSNAILFTENGERFQVVLNGILQNSKAETNVKLTGLNAPNYKARILFEDTKLGYVDFNLFFTEPGFEATWNIKKNKKGEYVVRGLSAVPLAQAPPAPPAQTIVVYSATPPPATTTTTTTTTSSGGTGDNVNFNMGVNMNENGGGVNINMSGMDGGTGTTSSTTTTSTSHSTMTTSSGSTPPPVTHAVYVDGYTGPVGCAMPMKPADFGAAKKSISSKSFEESKLTIAKQVFNNNCLTSSQVKEIMLLFSFEESRLDFAKYAYGYTYDTGNYFRVNDAFTFESSIDELNQYISSFSR